MSYHDFDPNSIDPGANWLLGPGLYSYLGRTIEERQPGEPIIPVMVRTGTRLDILAREGRLPNFVPLGCPVRSEDGNHIYTALTTRSFLQNPEFLGRLGQFCLQLSLPLLNDLYAVWPGQDPPVPMEDPADVDGRGLPDDSVVVAVIDDGIAIANDRFRRADGTSRFAYFWRQDGAVPSPTSVPYGRELAKPEIDALLAGSSEGGVVNEERFYRAAGLVDFSAPYHNSVAWRRAHGTHVLDLAAGEDRARDRANRPLIGVQLPVAATESQSGSGLEHYVVQAMIYIRDRAALLSQGRAKKLPIVINFSYGTYAGPHDGHSLLELAMDMMGASADPPIRLVLPAGNSNLARCHEEIGFRAVGESRHLQLRLQPDTMTTTTVQIWMPLVAGGVQPGNARIRLRLEGPGGLVSRWITETTQPDDETMPAAPKGQFTLPVQIPFTEDAPSDPLSVVGRYTFNCAARRGLFQINIGPSARVPADVELPRVLAPAGLWTITVCNEALPESERLEAWIERSDLLYGFPRRGRQAYFEEAHYRRYESNGRPVTEDPAPPGPSRREGMLNAIATGREPVVVGGYTRKDRRLADYSAFSRVPLDGRPAPALPEYEPDAVAVSDDSRVHKGVLAAGSRSGTRVAMRGTSVAAPQLTRAIAHWLASGQADKAEVRARAADAETLHVNWPVLPPRGGRGRLELGAPVSRPHQRLWRD